MLYSGVVQKGLGRGKTIGFPTANIPLTDDRLSGIYAAHVWIGNTEYVAAVYADKKRKLLEAHLVGYEGVLYGTEIEVQLFRRLREDAEFESEEKMKETIKKDVEAAINFFK